MERARGADRARPVRARARHLRDFGRPEERPDLAARPVDVSAAPVAVRRPVLHGALGEGRARGTPAGSVRSAEGHDRHVRSRPAARLAHRRARARHDRARDGRRSHRRPARRRLSPPGQRPRGPRCGHARARPARLRQRGHRQLDAAGRAPLGAVGAAARALACLLHADGAGADVLYGLLADDHRGYCLRHSADGDQHVRKARCVFRD